MNRLILIDGMSLLFRSFYAMGNHLTGPDGKPIGAVYGFLKVMLKIMKEQNPTHFAVCWDLSAPTFRHIRYPAYKANRGETPPDIIPQIQLMHELLPQLGVPTLSCAGYEADDLVATLATTFQDQEEIFLVTLDKDYMQLVTDRVHMISLKKGDAYEWIGPKEVEAYFGVPPKQVVEVLGLMGDSVDNIPGVKGIGPKGAAKLIQSYKSLEAVYDNLVFIGNERTRQALQEQKEQAFLSRELATLCHTVPLSVSLEDLRFNREDLTSRPQARGALEQLKMQSLARELYGAPSHLAGTDHQKSSWGQRDYICVQDEEQLSHLFQRMQSPNTQIFAFDTETTGLDRFTDVPIGFSVCFEPDHGFYVPVLGTSGLGASVWPRLHEVFHQRTALVVGHNIKFDWHLLQNVGVDFGPGPTACSMVAAWLNNPAELGGYGLDALTFKCFGFQKIPTQDLIGKATGRQTMLEVPLHELVEYACEDVDATLRVWRAEEEKLKSQNLLDLFFTLEMPTLWVLCAMERQGIYVDTNLLATIEQRLKFHLNELEEAVFEQVGATFSLTSPRQLGDILFEKLRVQDVLGYKGNLARTTQGYKTDASVLEQFSDHPVVALVQNHRELSKLLSTYVTTLPKLVHPKTGRVHTHFHQTGTSTGRLSSSEPNLQNVPVRTEWGQAVREAFCISGPDKILTVADYSQIELRVLAHLAKDETMISAFRAGIDIHRQTAAQILNKPLEDITSQERSHAKAINFGIIYGMGPQRLAKEQGISMSEARAFIERYFANFSKIKAFLDNMRLEAKKHGVVYTYFGRPRPLPALQDPKSRPMDIKFAENMAINSPIQGTAADIVKFGMIALQRNLTEKSLETRLLLQVHDELVLEGPKEEAPLVRTLIHESLEEAVSFAVPMTVGVGSGVNWVKAKAP